MASLTFSAAVRYIAEWSKSFIAEHGRKPTSKDVADSQSATSADGKPIDFAYLRRCYELVAEAKAHKAGATERSASFSSVTASAINRASVVPGTDGTSSAALGRYTPGVTAVPAHSSLNQTASPLAVFAAELSESSARLDNVGSNKPASSATAGSHRPSTVGVHAAPASTSAGPGSTAKPGLSFAFNSKPVAEPRALKEQPTQSLGLTALPKAPLASSSAAQGPSSDAVDPLTAIARMRASAGLGFINPSQVLQALKSSTVQIARPDSSTGASRIDSLQPVKPAVAKPGLYDRVPASVAGDAASSQLQRPSHQSHARSGSGHDHVKEREVHSSGTAAGYDIDDERLIPLRKGPSSGASVMSGIGLTARGSYSSTGRQLTSNAHGLGDESAASVTISSSSSTAAKHGDALGSIAARSHLEVAAAESKSFLPGPSGTVTSSAASSSSLSVVPNPLNGVGHAALRKEVSPGKAEAFQMMDAKLFGGPNHIAEDLSKGYRSKGGKRSGKYYAKDGSVHYKKSKRLKVQIDDQNAIGSGYSKYSGVIVDEDEEQEGDSDSGDEAADVELDGGSSGAEEAHAGRSKETAQSKSAAAASKAATATTRHEPWASSQLLYSSDFHRAQMEADQRAEVIAESRKFVPLGSLGNGRTAGGGSTSGMGWGDAGGQASAFGSRYPPVAAAALSSAAAGGGNAFAGGGIDVGGGNSAGGADVLDACLDAVLLEFGGTAIVDHGADIDVPLRLVRREQATSRASDNGTGNGTSAPTSRPATAKPASAAPASKPASTAAGRLLNPSASLLSGRKAQPGIIPVGLSNAASAASAALGDVRGVNGRPLCRCPWKLESALRKVKKDGRNKGRQFYCCPANKDAQCGFFMWKDDDAQAAVARFLTAARDAAIADMVTSLAEPAAASSPAARASASAAEESKIAKLSVMQQRRLQQEHHVRAASLKRWNDKAYGVKDLVLELTRRGLAPKVPKSWLEDARADDLAQQRKEKGGKAPKEIVISNSRAAKTLVSQGKDEATNASSPAQQLPSAAASAATKPGSKTAKQQGASVALKDGGGGAVVNLSDDDDADDGDDDDSIEIDGDQQAPNVPASSAGSTAVGHVAATVEEDLEELDSDDDADDRVPAEAFDDDAARDDDDDAESEGADDAGNNDADAGGDDDEGAADVGQTLPRAGSISPEANSGASAGTRASTTGGPNAASSKPSTRASKPSPAQRAAATATKTPASTASATDDFDFDESDGSDADDGDTGATSTGLQSELSSAPSGARKRRQSNAADGSSTTRKQPSRAATSKRKRMVESDDEVDDEEEAVGDGGVDAESGSESGSEARAVNDDDDDEDIGEGFVRRRKAGGMGKSAKGKAKGSRASSATAAAKSKTKGQPKPAAARKRKAEVAEPDDELEDEANYDDDAAGVDARLLPRSAIVSIKSLRRHECVALLVWDDVRVWREAQEQREHITTSSASSGAVAAGEPPAQAVAPASAPASLARTAAAAPVRPAPAPPAPQLARGAVTKPSLIPVLTTDPDDADPVGTILHKALKTTFGYQSFRGESRTVDMRTLEIVADVLPSNDGNGDDAMEHDDGKPSASHPHSHHHRRMTLQEWACRRSIAGMNTLLIAATGTGKSLCYQLPALLMASVPVLVPLPFTSTSVAAGAGAQPQQQPQAAQLPPTPFPYGITIVVSPLVSLMRDQMLRLPRGLTGVCLSGRSSQGAEDAASALIALRDRRAHVLFVSPERLFSRAFIRLARNGEMMPRVALVAVDEAHVVSEWSHNFRPSYLRLHALIHSILRPRSILALTATATPTVARNVRVALVIPQGGVWVSDWRRPNLRYSASWAGAISKEEERAQAAAAATAATAGKRGTSLSTSVRAAASSKSAGPAASSNGDTADVVVDDSSELSKVYPHDMDRSKALLSLMRSLAIKGLPCGTSVGASGFDSSGGIIDIESDDDDVLMSVAPAQKYASKYKNGKKRGSDGTLDAALHGRESPSTIIYVTTQAEADSLAEYLHQNGIRSGAYHAGLGHQQRERVHARFLSGALPVVVATVAFGMGLDKPDVRCIIHYTIPRSPEEYVQQCGRAGRDGHPAWCHALVDRTGEDFRRLHSLAHGDEVDWRQIAGLLCMLTSALARSMRVAQAAAALVRNEKSKRSGASTSSSVSIDSDIGFASDTSFEACVSLATMTSRLNLRPEVAETLLCYLESSAVLDIVSQRYTHVDIVVLKSEGAGSDPVIRAAVMLATAKSSAAATASAGTSSSGVDAASAFSFADPATNLLYPSSLFGNSDAMDADAANGGAGSSAYNSSGSGSIFGNAGRAGRDSISHILGGNSRSAASRPPVVSQVQAASMAQAISKSRGADWLGRDDRGRQVIRACLDDVAVAASAIIAHDAAAAASNASAGGSADPTAFTMRMSVGQVQRRLYDLQSAGAIALVFRDWGIAISVDPEFSELHQAALQAAGLLPMESVKSGAQTALSDKGFNDPQSSPLASSSSVTSTTDTSATGGESAGDGGSSQPRSSLSIQDAPTPAAALSMGVAPILFRPLQDLHRKVVNLTKLSVSRLEASHGLVAGASVSSWKRARDDIASTVDPGSEGNEDSATAYTTGAEALLLQSVGRYLSHPGEHVAAGGAAGGAGSAAVTEPEGGIITTASAAAAAAAPPAVAPPVLPLPANQRTAVGRDVAAVVRRMRTLLGSSSSATSSAAASSSSSSSSSAATWSQQQLLLLSALPHHGRPSAWNWWHPTNLITFALPSPIINAAAIARILHGINSPLFPSREWRGPGYGGGGQGFGSSDGAGLWGRWAAFDFTDVRIVAEWVLVGIAGEESRER